MIKKHSSPEVERLCYGSTFVVKSKKVYRGIGTLFKINTGYKSPWEKNCTSTYSADDPENPGNGEINNKLVLK